MLNLRIFAYHVESIAFMKNGDVNTYSPLEGIRIVVSRENEFYKVDGISAGNHCGAVAEYAKIVHDFCIKNNVTISPDVL